MTSQLTTVTHYFWPHNRRYRTNDLTIRCGRDKDKVIGRQSTMQMLGVNVSVSLYAAILCIISSAPSTDRALPRVYAGGHVKVKN